ncbi:MAG: enoyl-CoA hydratase/isomerase family protein [Bacteroidetes bacterium]|nr:enoyl-CoA hydratase/isomerase family protein [Bacteroidota bacterium]
MQNLLLNTENNILTITINRPDKLNALNKATIQELHDALKANSSNPEIKAIILTGSGAKAFVAGADISEFAHFSVQEGAMLSADGHKLLFDFVQNYPKPIIAAVNGFALGGGLELAMSCHFRVASANAKMGLPEVSLGVIPGYGGTQRLAQLVGKGKAMEMILTADMITAEDALKWGLINYVVAPEELLKKCIELASKICTRSPIALTSAIKAVNANYLSGVNGFEIEIEEFGNCFGTEDFKEGTSAFMEKRKANFPGK